MRQYKALGQNRFYFAPEWRETTQYLKDDVVRYLQDVYVCIADVTGLSPLDATNWRLIMSAIKHRRAYSPTGNYKSGDVVAYDDGVYVSNTRDVGSVLDLDFVEQKISHTPVFTRASIGTYFDQSGIMRTALSGQFRIDYDPISSEPLGLLVEEQRVNLAIQSENFDLWTKTGVTVELESDTAPDGNETANRIVEDSGDTQHNFSRTASLTLGQTVCFSIFVKAAERSAGRLIIPQVSADAFADFDLITGTIVAGDGAVAVGIIPLQNSFYRIWMTAVAVATGSADHQLILLNEAGALSYVGDTNAGMLAWGAQIEVGAFPSSYIPTTTAAVTRAADSVTLPTTGWYGTGGVISAEFSRFYVGAGHVFDLSDATAANSVSVSGGDELVYEVVTSSASQASITLGAASSRSHAASVAFLEDDFRGALDGDSAIAVTSGALPAVTTLSIGNNAAGTQALNGHIGRILYINENINDSGLQSLSALVPVLNGFEWSRLSINTPYRGEWTSLVVYEADDVVSFEGSFYRAKQQTSSSPKTNYWVRFLEAIGPENVWNPVANYLIGEIVAYQDNIYQALAETQTIPTGPDWEIFSDTIVYRGEWTEGTYQIGDVVDYEGRAYISTAEHVSQSLETDLLKKRWISFNDGLRYRGEWRPRTSYQAGDVIEREGSFIALSDLVSGLAFEDAKFQRYTNTSQEPELTFLIADKILPENATVFADTSLAGFRVSLPPSPISGDFIDIIDVKGTFSTNNLTISGNGNKIVRQDQDFVLDVNNLSVKLVYAGTFLGWLVR
jgi:hypothetical protein